LTTLLNPGLDGAVVLSSYADCGTMVASVLLAFSGSRYWRVCRLAALQMWRA
jgi:hypothetical protein